MSRWAVAGLGVVLAACGTTGAVSEQHGLGKSLLYDLVERRAWPAAFEVARQLHERDRDDAEVLALRGVIYREQRLLAEAEADLLEAVERAPRLAIAHAALAVLYDLQGRGADAEPYHRRAVELDPTRPSYLNNLGYSLWSRGRADEAIDAYQRALRLSPADARVHNNLGFARARQGEVEAAAGHFARGGTPAQARNNMGLAMEQLGRFDEARALYREAVDLDPTLQRARDNLDRMAPLAGEEPGADPRDLQQGETR